MKQLLCIGNSQWPLIRSGESVSIHEKDPNNLSPGSLAVYLGKRHFVCHRILKRKSEGSMVWYLFKGDNVRFADGWIPAYRIIGEALLNKTTLTSLFRHKLSPFFFAASILENGIESFAPEAFRTWVQIARKLKAFFRNVTPT